MNQPSDHPKLDPGWWFLYCNAIRGNDGEKAAALRPFVVQVDIGEPRRFISANQFAAWGLSFNHALEVLMRYHTDEWRRPDRQVDLAITFAEPGGAQWETGVYKHPVQFTITLGRANQ